MLRTFSCRFRIVVAVLFALAVAMSEAADTNIDNIQKDFVGSWIVEVDGEARTRTLNIKAVERKRDDIWILESTYGWTDGGQTAVNAELIAKPEGYRLQLTTQANSLISADYSSTNLFSGTFTWSSGKVRPARLERLSGEEIGKRAAILMASRVRSTIKQPAADVPASCAGFIGGWKGDWNWNVHTWMWVAEVNSSCIAKVAHRSTSEFPGSFQTVEVKGGVLAIRDPQGFMDSFELHTDQLWSRHAEPGRDNTGVFRKIQPSEN